MSTASLTQRLAIAAQYAAPQHLISRLAGVLADSPAPAIKRPFINAFARRYCVDMSEAANPSLDAYASFNDFFTRALRDGARPICEQGVASPADGAISQLGVVDGERIFQAKGHHYTLTQLLGGDSERAAPFINGHFATVYLSPRDYHRVHMPYGGRLREMIYVPGQLFSVNTLTARNVPRLFARNERVVALFDTDLGPMALVLVGAMVVASIETVWAGRVAPLRRKVIRTGYCTQQAIDLARGEEMGRFLLGSTAIVLFGEGAIRWRDDLGEGSLVRMGECLSVG